MFFAYFALILPFFVVHATENGGVNSAEQFSNSYSSDADNRFPRKWVADLFYETLTDFAVSTDVADSACQRQSQMYVQHLANDSSWAVQMYESWSRYPVGVLVGATHQMGVYDECIDVRKPIQGKYCIPSVKITSSTGENFTVGNVQTKDHAWQTVLGFVDDDLHYYRNIVKFGICIPNACSASDLKISLQNKFDQTFLPHKIKAQVDVESILCSTHNEIHSYGSGYQLTSLLLGSLVTLCCLFTAYDLIVRIRSDNGKKTYKIPEIFYSFSMIRNGQAFTKYNSDNKLNVFNGLKVVFIVFIFFGHKFVHTLVNPFTYALKLEKRFDNNTGDFMLTSMNLVDPFFYITGYLMYTLMMAPFSKPGANTLLVVRVIVYKYLKLMPAYGVMILMTAFVVPHLGDGPFWASRMLPEAEKCKAYWWANVLGVSNLIRAENQCLIASWFISCILQFIVIGTIVIYVCAKNKKIGISLLVLLLCGSLVLPFVITYVNKALGIVRIVRSFMFNPNSSFEFTNIYRPSYLRATPFFTGILAAIVVEILKKRKFKMHKLVVYIGTLFVFIVCYKVQIYGTIFYHRDRPYNVIEHSLYATLYHCTWTVIMFWISVCHFTSGYGPIEKIFNNSFLVPLGRLSYSVYLVNITVVMVMEGGQRNAQFITRPSSIDGWMISTIKTYIMGILLYFVVEAPIGMLIENCFRKKKTEEAAPDLKNLPITKTETEEKQLNDFKLTSQVY